MFDDAYRPDQPTEPSKPVAVLDRLVGTWTVTGEAEGTVRYEWMSFRFFLLQHVELTQYGQQITGDAASRGAASQAEICDAPVSGGCFGIRHSRITT